MNQVARVSLYVGDLHEDTNEALLYQKFSTIGRVISIRVCRDEITKKSLGYAYVNYLTELEAKHAMDTINFDLLKGKPMRLMWLARDSSLRKSGVGNIYVKNLEKSIDTKILHETFSVFGNISSCKIVVDECGVSKGFGFVHYEMAEAARNAIEKLNGMVFNNMTVYVGSFIPKATREKEYTNVFCKNFGEEMTEDELYKLFLDYGTISSCKLVTETDGKSKGFGFVSFTNSADATKAVAELNGKDINGKVLYVGRAQKKELRKADLKKKFQAIKSECIKKTRNSNLYVKNLDDCIDSERLHTAFSYYGTITSAKVMTENGRSKGFGFVCYELPEEAMQAITHMNGKIIVNKPLYVALAQRKEERKAHILENMTISSMQRRNHINQHLPSQQVCMQHVHNQEVLRRQQQQKSLFINPSVPMRNGNTRLVTPATHMFPGNLPQCFPAMQRYRAPLVHRRLEVQRPVAAPSFPQPPNKAMLSALSEEDQKQMLGGHLILLVREYISAMSSEVTGMLLDIPTMSSKITGMLLEIENASILLMFEDQTYFKKMVDQAKEVLEANKEDHQVVGSTINEEEAPAISGNMLFPVIF